MCRRSGVYAWPYGDQDGGLYPQTDEEADTGDAGRGKTGEETRLRRLGTVVGYRTVNGGRMGSAPNSKGFAKVQWDVDIRTPERLAAAEGRVEDLQRVKGVQDAMSPIEVTVCKSNKQWDLLVEAKLGVAFARWGVVWYVMIHLSGVVCMRAQFGQMTHGMLAPWVGQWLCQDTYRIGFLGFLGFT